MLFKLGSWQRRDLELIEAGHSIVTWTSTQPQTLSVELDDPLERGKNIGHVLSLCTSELPVTLVHFLADIEPEHDAKHPDISDTF